MIIFAKLICEVMSSLYLSQSIINAEIYVHVTCFIYTLLFLQMFKYIIISKKKNVLIQMSRLDIGKRQIAHICVSAYLFVSACMCVHVYAWVHACMCAYLEYQFIVCHTKYRCRHQALIPRGFIMVSVLCLHTVLESTIMKKYKEIER